jgi:DNA-binding IclR family transcriptional regulator
MNKGDVSEQGSGVQVIDRAAAILKLLGASPEGMSFSALATRVDLPRTTVHRICRALQEVGFVSYNAGSGRLQLGSALVRLAVTARRDMRAVVQPYLERLSKEINETVDLAVLDGGHALFIAQHPAPQRQLMAVARVGVRFPAHCTANGKSLLAELPPEDLKHYLPERLEIPARKTVISRNTLLRELDEVRRTGLAFDREENGPGVCSVAVALTDMDGSVASMSVPMPASRFYEDEDTVIAALVRMRDEVQAKLLGE